MVCTTDLKRMLLLRDGSKLMRSMAILMALALVSALKSSYEPFHGTRNVFQDNTCKADGIQSQGQ